MPKVLPEYLEQRRQQILDAAAACFSRHGFHRTTMKDICEETALSPGAVYRYFRGKDQIIEAMCERGYLEDVEKIRGSMELGETLEVFDELIRLFFVPVPSEYCALNLELTAESRRNEYIREFRQRGAREVRAQLAEIVRRAQTRSDVDPSLDAEAVGRVMAALYQGLLIQQLIEPEMDIRRYADVARALFSGRFWQGGQSALEAEKPAKARLMRH